MGATFVTGNRTTFGFATERMLRLSFAQMAIVGAAILLLLAGSFFLAGPIIGFGAVFALLLGLLFVRDPIHSILAFVVINVVLILRPKQVLAGGAPTPLDLFLGLFLGAVMCYWLLRLRVVENQPLSHSTSQFLIILFAIWSIFVTVIGFLTGGNNSLGIGIREMLNLSPLVILPILYERFVEPDSKPERAIFLSVFVVGLIVLAWNFYRVRSSALQAVYMYETSRGNSDESLSAFLVLLATSMFVSVRRLAWKNILVGLLFLFAILGVVVSFSRMLYVATIVSVVFLLFLSKSQERRQGLRRIAGSSLIGILALIPVYYTSRLVRLLALNYGLRFITTHHVASDLSLRMRYTEWANEWQWIIHSPILGYGFGSFYRTFDLALHHHSWVAFSHSSYLFIVFKTGFVGAFLLFAAWAIFLHKGFRLLSSELLSPLARVMVRACVAYLVMFLICMYTDTLLSSKTDLIWVGLMWGYFLALEKKLGVQADSMLPEHAKAVLAVK